MKALVNSLTCPIIVAPMAGGPSTPTLTDAAWRAGGFGFLAAGMLTLEALERQMRATTCPYGVNVFMPHDDPASFAPLYNYAARHGLSIDPTSVDSTDGWDAKMALILRAAGVRAWCRLRLGLSTPRRSLLCIAWELRRG